MEAGFQEGESWGVLGVPLLRLLPTATKSTSTRDLLQRDVVAEFKPSDFGPPGMNLTALQGMAASKIQDFQSLICLWRGKEPEGGFSFPFQDTELELEPNSHPQSPRTGCGTGGASAALGVQDLSQVGSKGRNSVWSFTFPPEFTERGGSKQLHWSGSWIFYFLFFLVAQNSCWSSSSWSGRYWEEAAKTIPRGWTGSGLGAPLSGDAPSHGPCEIWRAGPGWAFPQQECGRLQGVAGSL